MIARAQIISWQGWILYDIQGSQIISWQGWILSCYPGFLTGFSWNRSSKEPLKKFLSMIKIGRFQQNSANFGGLIASVRSVQICIGCSVINSLLFSIQSIKTDVNCRIGLSFLTEWDSVLQIQIVDTDQSWTCWMQLNHLSPIKRKSVLGVCDQGRLKLVCSSTATS